MNLKGKGKKRLVMMGFEEGVLEDDTHDGGMW